MLDVLMRKMKAASAAPLTAAQLRERRVAAYAAAREARAAIDQLGLERRDAILTGDADRLTQLDAELERLRREVPDLDGVAEELYRRERRAQADEDIEAGLSAARQLPALLAAAKEAEKAYAAARAALGGAGRRAESALLAARDAGRTVDVPEITGELEDGIAEILGSVATNRVHLLRYLPRRAAPAQEVGVRESGVGEITRAGGRVGAL